MDWKELSIGEFASLYPGAITVFKRMKIDFCCGGHKPLKEELDTHDHLTSLLEMVIAEKDEAPPSLINYDQSELIEHILKRFHEKHKRDLPELISLAKKVEAVHKENSNVPRGLTAFLRFMQEELLSHMEKEEIVLFPLIKSTPKVQPLMPINVMMAEHDEHKASLERLAELTNNFHPPEDACYSWQALYQALEDFVHELKEHIHLENNILFPRALAEDEIGEGK